MLSELNGSGPVLLALTGNDESLGKVNWKNIRKKIGKVAKVGAWVVAPGAMATVAAAKATKAALKRKQAKNIANLKIERAQRAAKLAEARKRQAEAEAAAKKAQAANAATPAAPSYSPAAPSYFPDAPEYESPVEEVNETPDAPAEESEKIQDTSEEGAEESAEVMGYARSNDDYFVGSPLKSTISNSGQLRLVRKVGTPNNKLLIVGGLVVGAYLFRKQLKKMVRG